MKTIILTLALTILLAGQIFGADTYASRQSNFVFPTNCIDFAVNEGTTLMPFGPPYGTNPIANVPRIVATNGLECLMDIPSGWLYLYNHTTNDMACLGMPATNLCRIALLDKQGHQVRKTELGKMYGLPLSQEQIDYWRFHSHLFRRSEFIRLFQNGIPQYVEPPTEICNFDFKDAFEIKEAGEYELHVQMRLIQVGQDSSRKIYYPVTWLPEVTAKILIRSADIPLPDSPSNAQTNDISPELRKAMKLNSTRQP